jgi:hypothetical protein
MLNLVIINVDNRTQQPLFIIISICFLQQCHLQIIFCKTTINIILMGLFLVLLCPPRLIILLIMGDPEFLIPMEVLVGVQVTKEEHLPETVILGVLIQVVDLIWVLLVVRH